MFTPPVGTNGLGGGGLFAFGKRLANKLGD